MCNNGEDYNKNRHYEWDVDSTITFGKYAGKSMSYVLEHDPAFLEWFLYMDNFEITDELKDEIDAHLEEGCCNVEAHIAFGDSFHDLR